MHAHVLAVGSTAEELAEVRRLALVDLRRRRTPSQSEVEAQELGAKLLTMAIPAGLSDGDVEVVAGHVYLITVRHQRSYDDIEERVGTARIETKAHEVLARGRVIEIESNPVADQTLDQFVEDFPALAQLFSRLATEHFIHDHRPVNGYLRHVMVSVHQIEHTLIESHESLILTVVGLGLAVAIPPLGVLGVPWVIEAALGGAAALAAHGAVGAIDEDMERRNKAATVRKHLDVNVRAHAIQDFDRWARGLGRELQHAQVQPHPHVPVHALT